MPPVINGQSLVTKRIYDLLKSKGADIKLIRLGTEHNSLYARAWSYFVFFIKVAYFLSISRRKVIYFPGARSVFGFYRNLTIILLSKICGHKTIMHIHFGDYDSFLLNKSVLFKKINQYIYQQIDCFIVLSNSLIKNYSSIVPNGSDIRVIPNCVEIQSNGNSKFFSNSINIIYISNLIESKGYLDVLSAVNILVNDLGLRNIKCQFFGSFVENEMNLFKNAQEADSFLRGYILENNLSQNVVFPGVVLGVQKDSVLSDSDIFILPTYYSTEAQPLSVLEAMSYGKLVIATNHRALEDIIIDGVNGLIVPPKSPKSIADAIVRLIGDVELTSILSYNARSTTISNFSPSEFNREIVKVFNDYNILK